MIIQLTDKCSMECIHCMFSCNNKNKNHMTEDVLNEIIQSDFFIKSKCIHISGGEPLEHPNFFKFLDMVLEKAKQKLVTIVSNGMFTYNKHLIENLLERLNKHECLFLQITNDPMFYPINIPEVKHGKISFSRDVHTLVALGRAKNLGSEYYKRKHQRIAPFCFNSRLTFLKIANKDLVQTMIELESLGKSCESLFTPEGDYCPSECGRYILGNIMDKNFLKKANFKASKNPKPCDECGVYSSMNPIIRSQLQI